MRRNLLIRPLACLCVMLSPLVLLSGCGAKGDLVLPEETPAVQSGSAANAGASTMTGEDVKDKEKKSKSAQPE